jgi:hypothetical protein
MLRAPPAGAGGWGEDTVGGAADGVSGTNPKTKTPRVNAWLTGQQGDVEERPSVEAG